MSPFGVSNSSTASFQAFAYVCCNYTSTVCLVIITVNCFVSILFPNAYRSLFTSKRTTIIISASWLLVPLCLLPILAQSVNSDTPIFGWNDAQLLCTFILNSSTGSWTTYMQVLQVLFQFFPIVSMVILYCAMFWMMTNRKPNDSALPWKENITILGPESNMLNTKEDLCCTANAVQLDAEELRIAKTILVTNKRKNERQLLIVSVAICSAYAILLLPSLIINLLPNRRSLDIRIYMAASNITWLSICVNPFIYVLANPKFRAEYAVLLRYLWLKCTCKL